MWESLSQLSALSIFLFIAAVGFLFVLVSFVFGEVFEHFDFDHDVGHEGPSLFSTRVVAVFATSFGAFGAIGVYLGLGALLSSLFAVAGGFVLAWMVYLFARFLYSQQSSSLVSSTDLVGLTAQVTVGIPAEGVGQVRCIIGESMVEKIARSRDGRPIPHDSVVMIEEIAGESVIVSPHSARGEGRGLFT